MGQFDSRLRVHGVWDCCAGKRARFWEGIMIPEPEPKPEPEPSPEPEPEPPAREPDEANA
ncbi:MAG: hypothetical protein E6J42_12635 [Chloroflexi bacterium]|nr:MAG: hypothetical protein E6J42_12635 [Chloroflexota bacterium]